ncbi:type I methionyl aminopeptidase [Candidatus Kinetoplastidibacterium galati]|uniref:Methionine aminopeptidase n=1 Tax=Candidatus Kinetoplastidibacterium galati TCC219 TaxID=1208921 RepID=M1M160_9PROT|nr:type I methionyl aminopeptidase [Candidatus Kinetoplastibacterium galatii]AGF49024.1 methionyl aminopeptidase [Candidatus Kinetoplastibacterium galatii TCC219]
MGIIKNKNDLNKMRSACQDAAKILDFITSFVKPGVTTGYLDKLCKEYLTDELKVKSATVGYAPPGHSPFPGAICTSVNHQVCHGIPGNRILKNGDSLNIDVTIIKDEWYGDTSRMYHVGDQSIQSLRLSEIAYECMWKGIQKVKNYARLGDIGHAIQKHAEEAGFSVVREFCGHGIGKNFHENPQVLHYGKPNTGELLKTGMLITIEPMINAGKRGVKQLSDGWTIVTCDHSLSAQWEHTICVTDIGYEVLTVSSGTPKPPSFIDNQDIF